VEEYRRLEAAATEKHEYWNGWMYPRMYPPGSHWAMAGGTLAHARLIVRLLRMLDAHLEEHPCVVYPDDVRLYVNDHDYFYPDAFVTCGGTDEPTAIEQHDATLIAEVLSPSTSSFDQGDRFDAYSVLPSLHEYLLLDPRRVQATLYRRAMDGAWLRLVTLEGADLVLESIGFRAPLAQLYRGVPLAPLVPDDDRTRQE
jgi:Uma2 family endonuclease